MIVEGTQGTFLSLYHGTYPFVTSRDTTAAGVISEVGVSPRLVSDIVLVFKAYVTRVGAGELPGELSMEEVIARGVGLRGARSRAGPGAPHHLTWTSPGGLSCLIGRLK